MFRRVLVVFLAMGLLVVPGTAVAVQAEASLPDEPRAERGDEALARGILVRTENPTRTTLRAFDEFLPLSQALLRAEQVAQEPGVTWAEPDLVLGPSDITIPNDPLFDQQWSLWEGGSTDDVSVRAPLIWGIDSGDPGVVVAVIDTGVAAHPDLAARVIAGYDFVSDIAMANDGNGWDANPADPGDWISQADINSGEFSSGCDLTASTWHGTHVAGIIAAQWNNEYGISGAAPNVTVQNVRGLGKCGGTISDIAAAIRWAAGDTVVDELTGIAVPMNPTPADVINLSLGGASACTKTMADAVSTARALGSVVIAAAGNEAAPVSSYLPANCPGALAVAATDATGAQASYSNFGVTAGQIFIAALGGGGGRGILSTDNTGLTSPAQPDFDVKAGTSMATPLVAAAAALIASSGVTGPGAIEQQLGAAVRSFPVTGGQDCTLVTCGAGLLRFDLLAAAIALDGERGTVRGRNGVLVDGTTLGLPEGELVTPYTKFPGETSYTRGVGVRRVSVVSDTRGEFTWQRRTGKKIFVYFRSASGEQSKRVIIPA